MAYELPDGNVQIAFSGGRSSAYMIHQILEANGGLPDRVEVTFQNTGREFEETLEFVAECDRRWGLGVTWLEYRGNDPMFEVVGFQGASRNGEPFDALIDKKQYLPNQQTRFCTIELKIRTAKRYLRSLGWEHWTNAIGFRGDESSRVEGARKSDAKDRWTTWCPMHSAGVSKHDVALFWRSQPFDLKLASVNGKTPDGNCDGCFLKSQAYRAGLYRDHPARALWWKRAEKRIAELETKKGRPKDNSTFDKRESWEELIGFVDRQGDWVFDEENEALCGSGFGECVA